MASVYNPLEIISPTTITGKITYSNLCDSKRSWYDKLPDWILRKWKKWWTKLPTKIKMPRSITLSKESLNLINIYLFRDAS